MYNTAIYFANYYNLYQQVTTGSFLRIQYILQPELQTSLIILVSHIKKIILEAGETAQWIRALILEEDLGSIPSIHMATHNYS